MIIKRIIFNNNFFPINILPPTITHITFGKKFNQKVCTLPSNITHVEFIGDDESTADDTTKIQ